MPKKIILLSGWKRSGKDTAAAFFEEHGYKRASFAATLKDAVAKTYGLPRAHLDDQEKKEQPLEHMPAVARDKTSEALINQFRYELRFLDGSAPVWAAVLNGHVVGSNERNKESQLFFTPRALMIIEGAMRRLVSPNYWVNATFDNTKENNIVISDWRFKNEYNAVVAALRTKDRVIKVRINRFETNPSMDPTENDLNDETFDYVIKNVGSIEDLRAKLARIL